MKYSKLILKPGRDKAIRNRHHWIFSGAVQKFPECQDGELVEVRSATNEMLGTAYWNNHSSIIGRMVSFGNENAEDAVREHIMKALELREQLFDENTNGFRLINSEGDLLPGLVVDQYDEALVVQISTLGMEHLKPLVMETLKKALKPKAILERSNLPSRKEEGMPPFEGLLAGEDIREIEIVENNLKFQVSFENTQKTGFFLDQREMRSLVKTLAKDKNVLNCFSFTGGFSVYALAGGAKNVVSVDTSKDALELAKKNVELNGFKVSKEDFVEADVFEYLRKDPLNYDLVILDPPAFAKHKSELMRASRGYKDINMVAMKKMPAGSMLLTSSCSYSVDEKLFQQIIFAAAKDAGRNVQIIGRHRLAPDHPINVYHPEGEYLKSLLLWVE